MITKRKYHKGNWVIFYYLDGAYVSVSAWRWRKKSGLTDDVEIKHSKVYFFNLPRNLYGVLTKLRRRVSRDIADYEGGGIQKHLDAIEQVEAEANDNLTADEGD